MQIRTITCHDVYNHGASLQAYALQTYLESLGHDVRIIDYKPDYLSGHYSLWSVDNPIYNKPIIKQLYLLAKLPKRLIALKRKKKFDEFSHKFFKLTQRYNNYEELKKNPPQADVYIAGSDQIWNTLFQNGRDAAFYLDFVPKTSKRFAYAASFATKDVTEECRSFVIKMLQNFDAISIRESISLPLLESLGRNDGIAVCDPVFLLSREQWNSIISSNRIHEKFLLVYDTEGSEKIKIIAKKLAKAKNLKIYNVSASKLSYTDKDLWASGPLDFIQLIRDSQFVISNSFHASAFSMIFERDFCVVNRSEGINERMNSLLSDFGLSERLVNNYSDELMSSINYHDINKKIEIIISNSKKYLNNSLI